MKGNMNDVQVAEIDEAVLVPAKTETASIQVEEENKPKEMLMPKEAIQPVMRTVPRIGRNRYSRRRVPREQVGVGIERRRYG